MSQNYTPGRYFCATVGKQGFSEAGTGTPQFFLKFNPTHRLDPKTNGWVEVESSERTWYQALTMNTQAMFVERLRALKCEVTSLMALSPDSPNFVEITGGHEFDLKVETYNGKTQEKWEPATGSGAREEKLLDKGALGKLDMIFGAALKKSGPPAAAPKPPALPNGAPSEGPF